MELITVYTHHSFTLTVFLLSLLFLHLHVNIVRVLRFVNYSRVSTLLFTQPPS